MAEQDNSDVVRRVYESFRAGDIDAMLASMADDVEWQLPEIAGVPFSGKRQGHASIREFFAGVAAMQDVDVMELNTIVAQAAIVVVLGRYAWQVKATGRNFSSDFAHAFHMVDGKVGRFQEFLDTAAAAAAYEGA